MEERGIVITPRFLPSKGNRPRSVVFDRAYLRFCALYWDKIDTPAFLETDFVKGDSVADLALLQSEKILGVTAGYAIRSLDITGSMIDYTRNIPAPEFWAVAQLYAHKKRGGFQNGWVLGQDADHLLLPEPECTHVGFSETPHLGSFNEEGQPFLDLDALKSKQGPMDAGPDSLTVGVDELGAGTCLSQTEDGACAEIKLYRCLPVPPSSTSLQEVLEFKERRAAELEDLRFALKSLYFDVGRSDDFSRSLDHAIHGLQRSLDSVSRVMGERFRDRLASSTSVKIGFDPMCMTTLVTSAVAQHLLDLPSIAPALATLASMVKISVDLKGLRPKGMPKDQQDFAYVYHAEEELGAV